MPKEIAGWPVAKYIALYLASQKSATQTKLNKTEARVLENDLPVYLESYFTDAFGDNGTLQRMEDLESRPLDDMAQHQHKATKLELSWGSDETTKAHAIAKSLQGKLRDRKEDPADAAEITNEEYLEWITYETRYRICSEQRPPPSQILSKRGATNNLLVVSLSCT
jgi:hypothetical protein